MRFRYAVGMLKARSAEADAAEHYPAHVGAGAVGECLLLRCRAGGSTVDVVLHVYRELKIAGSHRCGMADFSRKVRCDENPLALRQHGLGIGYMSFALLFNNNVKAVDGVVSHDGYRCGLAHAQEN